MFLSKPFRLVGQISAFLLIASQSAYSLELNGAGRRIPGPIFNSWSTQYSAQHPGITIKYQEINSTEGVKQVEQGTADFGDTDMPLSKAELGKRGLVQFPYMYTAITPIVNLPGVFDGQLNLTGKTLGDIYLGKIARWNDPAIVADNPRLKLPNEKIIVVHRTAEGGGTYTLSSYMAKLNPEWQSKVGVGVTLNWPVGTAVENLYAMGDFVKKTPYSIGYSEIAYTRKNSLVYVKLQNNAGLFVSPHNGSVEEALQNVRWNAANGFYENLVDLPGTGSWPMSSASYIVLRKTSDNVERRIALLKFIGWGLRLGDMVISELDFLPIQRSILPLIRNSWNDTPLVLEGTTVVTAAQVKALIESDVPVIDARVKAEYDTEHIARSISVPYLEKSAKSATFNPVQDSFDLSKLPADKKAGIIFYCNAGACWKGYKAAVVAVNAGYKKVYWFRGGLPEWLEKNYATESSFPAGKK